ncbi:hypothetical protein ACLK2H_10435 [Escherichia coli]
MLPPSTVTLPWRQDAAEHYFAPLSASPWAMLLHSGYAVHPHSRYDIVVAEPRATLVTRGGHHEICEADGEPSPRPRMIR